MEYFRLNIQLLSFIIKFWITASDGTTQLDHEIEKYDGITGILVGWVA